jgi:hypothetical protein
MSDEDHARLLGRRWLVPTHDGKLRQEKQAETLERLAGFGPVARDPGTLRTAYLVLRGLRLSVWEQLLREQSRDLWERWCRWLGSPEEGRPSQEEVMASLTLRLTQAARRRWSDPKRGLRALAQTARTLSAVGGWPEG